MHVQQPLFLRLAVIPAPRRYFCASPSFLRRQESRTCISSLRTTAAISAKTVLLMLERVPLDSRLWGCPSNTSWIFSRNPRERGDPVTENIISPGSLRSQGWRRDAGMTSRRRDDGFGPNSHYADRLFRENNGGTPKWHRSVWITEARWIGSEILVWRRTGQ